MASSPIISWKIDGETMEIVTDFILEGSQITADGDCSHEIIRYLLLGRKAMTNLDSIFETCIISHKKRITSPGSMQDTGCLGLVHWGWCTGMTQRDVMGRDVGGGSGWGTRVYLWRIHVDVWQNQYNIVKS